MSYIVIDYRAVAKMLEAQLREIATCGVSYDAGKYVEVQIDREIWDRLVSRYRAAPLNEVHRK